MGWKSRTGGSTIRWPAARRPNSAGRMSMSKLLVTGSSGLIGSEVVGYFCKEGFDVHGIDNNMRADFFGPQGDTRWNQQRLGEQFKNFTHHELDIRDRAKVGATIKEIKPDLL